MPAQQWIPENIPQDHTGRGQRTAGTAGAERQVGREFGDGTAVPRPGGTPESAREHAEHLESAEAVSGCQNAADGIAVVKLDTWLDNVRKHAANPPTQRHADLDALGIRR
ncbi:hypothetical protein ACH4CE_31910 [Streptomyces gelaticus]|uniref:hypothetical protein n=1 Tax=Streptomyces gelaticus TaxID=285446 RepID=UPI0037A32B4B